MSRGKRVARLATIGIVLVGMAAGCGQFDQHQAASAAGKAQSSAPAQTGQAFAKTRQGLLEQIAEKDRLAPDKRFIGAFNAIDRLFGHAPQPAAAARFEDGKWSVFLADKPVAQLSESPDFAEALEQLTAFARTRLSETGWQLSDQPAEGQADILALLNDGRDIYVAEAANRLGRQWQGATHNRNALELATQALAMLQFQQLDDAQVAEQLPMQSMAMLALARAAELNVAQAEALVAHSLGYSAHAHDLVTEAGVAPVLAAFFQKDYAKVNLLATDANARGLDRLCNLLLAGRSGESRPWSNALVLWERNAQPQSLAWGKAASTHAAGAVFALENAMMESLPRASVYVLGQVSAGERVLQAAQPVRKSNVLTHSADALSKLFTPSQGRLARALEESLPTLNKRFNGAFLPGDVYADYFRSHFYSGLYDFAVSRVDYYGDPDRGESFLQRLGDSSEPRIKAFREWYTLVVAASRDEQASRDFDKTLEIATRFSPAAALRVMAEQQETTDFATPNLIVSARHMQRNLDSRPEHRDAAARILYNVMLDLPEADRVARSAYALDPERLGALEQKRAWWSNDIASMQNVLKQTNTTESDRVRALTALRDMDALSKPEFAEAIGQVYVNSTEPNRYIYQYGKALIDAEQYEKVKAVHGKWLIKNKALPGMQPVDVKVQLARAERLTGRLKKAYGLASDAAQSGKASAVAELMRAEEALGNADKALELAQLNVSRYPRTVWLRVELASLYWQAGDTQGAAAVFGKPEPRFSELVWRDEIGVAMVKAYAGRSKEEVLAAAQALLAAGVDPAVMRGVGHAFGRDGRHEEAAAIFGLLRFPGLGQFTLNVSQYLYERRYLGEQAALAALQNKVPPAARNPFSMIAYEQSPALLWSMIPEPENSAYPEMVWLLRAYSALIAAQPEHLVDAKAYFAKQSNSHYVVLGRYVTGQASEEAALAQATNPKQTCEVVYALAIKALAEGRRDEATKLFRIVLETLSSNDGEYRWAYDQLYRWRKRGAGNQWLIGASDE